MSFSIKLNPIQPCFRLQQSSSTSTSSSIEPGESLRRQNNHNLNVTTKPHELRFPLKSNCAHYCTDGPHFPCKDTPCIPAQAPTPILKLPCKETLKRPTPLPVPDTSSPTYAPNHPWFQQRV